MPNLDQEERKVGERRNGLKRNRGRAQGKGGESVLFACLEEEAGPGNTEIPENEVIFARIHINLANVLGCNDWERKNWEEEECSNIIDTGFNGCGLCSSLG